ncbi:MAG TPA: SMC-Scp complex subunit ScpB [Microthrixaceae bacterium]|nr:SMC-Scp complex subunit ScpB [Microthrixaceae bacterium]
MPDGAGPADDPAETEPASPDGPDALSPIGDEARRALEAVIMVADQPIEASILAQLVERSPQQVEDLLAGLAASYEEDGRGFQLVRIAGGWRYQSHEDLSPYVERFVLSGQSARLSAAALETLAIVAYKQPISRAQVSAIRGVNVDGVMRTLQQRGYIAEVGKDPTPGNPSMFATTPLFLEKLGLNDVDELPSLGDFIPGADVVELLEQGLRAEADADPTPQAVPGDAPEGPDPAATVDVVDAVDTDGGAAEVIDVTDHVPIDVDDLIGDGDPLAEG